MALKKQLKLYLNEKGMTASQLAKKSGVAKQSISDWLLGSNPRDIHQVKKVADVFKITVDHLMFEDGLSSDGDKVTELDALLGNEWISGTFEVRLRRIKKQ